jgi:plasmid stabilization system protein ParE
MRLEIRPQAADEIDEAALWYEQQRSGLGGKFTQAVTAALETIAERPSAFPLLRRRARRFILRKFSYLIVYRQENDAIVVYACIHSHRDPERWRTRL